MAMTCPACGSAASGKFCSQCGASLAGTRSCASCGNEIPAGGRFCNMCGVAVAGAAVAATPGTAGAAAGGAGAAVKWLSAVGGVVVLALLLMVLVPRLQPGEEASALAPPGPLAGNPSAIDLSSMTPRQAADSLFNRVMRNVGAGDSVGARRFVPMAISAYQLVPESDADLHYHVAMLHLVNGDAESARTAAQAILAQIPTHLFGLYTAAQAEQLLGNVESSRELYGRFLDNYEAEVATTRVEYSDHGGILDPMRQNAARVLGR